MGVPYKELKTTVQDGQPVKPPCKGRVFAGSPKRRRPALFAMLLMVRT